jgi:hypothetical protein
MSRFISSALTIFAFAATVGAVTPANALLGGCLLGCGGGGLGIDIGLDLDLDLDLDLGACFDIDLDLGAACTVVAGVDASLYCDPLSVEAVCAAELGLNPDIEVWAACLAQVTAHCEAEIEAGGALFCDGLFVGADICLGGLLGIDLDVDAALDVDLGLDVDLDLDLGVDACFDVDLDVGVDCEVALGLECIAKCDPLAVQAACLVELGLDADLHAFAACEAALIAHCYAACELDGALFCDGDIYVGAGSCL